MSTILAKVKGDCACKRRGAKLKKGDALTAVKAASAEEARRAAVDIVEDALRKGCYAPSPYPRTCTVPHDPYVFTFCAVPTEYFLRDVLKTLREVRFMEDNAVEYEDVFAYVIPDDRTHTVYLCKLFWGAPDDLRMDSKPGTLIHEVSHFLGTEDVTYENLHIEAFESNGVLMYKRTVPTNEEGEHYKDEKGNVFSTLEVGEMNANSLEYEYETIINHEGRYENGSYTCCGEVRKNSVCSSRETRHYRPYQSA